MEGDVEKEDIPTVDLRKPTIKKRKRVRFDADFHQFIKYITETAVFNGFIMFTIFCNAVTIAMETSYKLKEKFVDEFLILDELFFAIYTVEFFMKVYAEPKNYWKSSYNIFDFLILVISLIQAILLKLEAGESGLQVLRIFRALRALRTLRTISFIRGLQVLVTALFDTIRQSVINIVMLLLLTMFLFGIMGYYVFGYKEDGDKEHWGDLGKAMLTLFSYVTVDGWTDIHGELEERGMAGSEIYTIVFIFLGHFIFTNVFVGVIIMNISEATENYKQELIAEREATLKHKKEFMLQRQHNDVRQMIEKQKRGHFSNFHDMVKEFERTLRHDDCVMMSDLCTNLVWIETFMFSLDHMDNTMYRIQQLQFEMANCLGQVLERRLAEKYGTL